LRKKYTAGMVKNPRRAGGLLAEEYGVHYLREKGTEKQQVPFDFAQGRLSTTLRFGRDDKGEDYWTRPRVRLSLRKAARRAPETPSCTGNPGKRVKRVGRETAGPSTTLRSGSTAGRDRRDDNQER
jgi:hypothetical protein